MKFNFYTKASSLVGIDLHPTEIRLVQLKKFQQAYQAVRLMAKELPKDTFCEGKIKSWDRMSSILTELIETMGLKNSLAAIGLSSNLVIMQQITLPKGLTHEEIEAEIDACLHRDLPGLQGELSIDFNELSSSHTADAEFFFAATRQEYLSQFIACINASGLQVKIVDVDIYALKRIIFHCLPGVIDRLEVSAILYSTNNNMILVVCNREYILFHQFWNLAETTDFYAQLKNKIQLGNGSANKKIKKLILCGNYSVNLLQTVSFLVEEVTYLNPFEYLKLATTLDPSSALRATDFLVACGLAMREIPQW